MLIRHSAIYLAANSVSALLGFAGVYVFTRMVAPAEYGIYIVAAGLGTIVSTVVFTWLRHSLLRFQSAGGDTDIRRTALVGYGLTLAVHPIVALGLVVVAKLPAMQALAVVAFAAALSLFELGQETLRARQMPQRFMLGTVLRSALSFLFCLAAVLSGGGGLALIVAIAAAYVLSTAMLARTIWQPPLAAFDRATLTRLFMFGAPITFSGLLFALYTTLDRLALAWLLGADVAGIYGATADFVRQSVVYPAVSASMAIAPIAVFNLANASADVVRRHLEASFELLLALVVPAVVGIAIVAPQVANVLLGPQYREAAASLMPVLAFIWLAQAVSQQYVQLSFNLGQRTGLYAAHNGIVLAVNAAGIVPLINAFGILGAAWSALLGEVAGVAFGIYLSRRAYPLPLVPGRVARVTVAAAVMAVAALTVRTLIARNDLVGLFAVVLTGVASYAAAAYALDLVGCRGLIRRQLARFGLGLGTGASPAGDARPGDKT